MTTARTEFETTDIAVKLDGRRYSFWKSANIHMAIGEISREVDLVVSDGLESSSAAANLIMGSEICVLCKDKTVLTGFIDDVHVNYNGSSHSITIRARSKTCDLVDCSFTGNAQFNGQSAKRTIMEICRPFDINVIWDCSDWTIGEMNTSVGDTCAGIITEICKRGGVFYTDDAFGNLVISDLSDTASRISIYNKPSQSVSNVLSCNARFSARDRFSEYTVESQDTAMDGDESAERAYTSNGKYNDSAVKRYRPKIVIAQTNQDSMTDKNSAELEYMAAIASAAECEYSINGWNDDNGDILHGGIFVNVSDEFTHVDNTLIIKSVDLTVSNNAGCVSNIKLVYPNALIKNYVPKTHSNDPWFYSNKEV